MALDTSSVRKMTSALKKGKVTEQELIKEYTKMRKTVMRQIQRIQKTATPFSEGARPKFATIRELSGPLGVDIRALIRELFEMTSFRKTKSYSKKARADTRLKTLATLRKRGINISDSQYDKWVSFITWFKHSAWSALYDSDEQKVMAVFEQGSTAEEWDALFREIGGS